jgi:hypothetical protein
VVGAWAGMGNIGDDWLLHTAAEWFEQRGADVALLLEGPADDAVAGGRQLLRWPSATTASAADWRALQHRLCRFDALVLVGGGYLSADQGLRSPLRWLRRFAAVPIPIIGCGLGFGPFPTRISRQVARQLIRRFDTLNVRTAADAADAASAGAPLLPVAGDVVLASPPLGSVGASRRGVVVAVARPHEHWLPRRWWPEYAVRIREQAEAWSFGEPITYLSFQGGEAGASDADHFREYFPVVQQPADVAEARRAMASARVALTGRLHAGFMAAHTATPQVCIAYHRKFAALTSGTGVPTTPVLDFVRRQPVPAPCTGIWRATASHPLDAAPLEVTA